MTQSRWMVVMGKASTVIFVLLLIVMVVGLPLFGVFEANFAEQEAAHNRVVDQHLVVIGATTSAVLKDLVAEVNADAAYGNVASVKELEKEEAEIDAICKVLNCIPAEAPGSS